MAGRHRKTRQSQRGRHRKPPQRQRVIIPAVAGIAVLSAGGMAVANAVVGSSAPHQSATHTGSVLGALPMPSLPSPPRTAARSGTATVTTPAHLTRRASPALVVTDVHGPCYVSVSRHGTLLTRTILRQGQQLVFRRHGLDVVLGNAGAVRLRIDGHHAVRPGHSGEVRNLRVN